MSLNLKPEENVDEVVYGECRFPVSNCSEFNIALQDSERVRAMKQFGTRDKWRRQRR